MITVAHETLRKQLSEIYRAWGMDEDHIAIVVNNMVESDLRGIDSHGVGMLPTYAERRGAGAVNVNPDIKVVRDFGAIALIDADHGLGHVPATRGMEMACDKALQFGVGAVTVRNANHFGAAGVYSTMASARGLIGICMTGTTQRAVLPTFAKEPRYSTNPIAFAAPAKRNDDFSLDMATSTIAVGKLNIARRAEKEIPIGWASDENGVPTTDPVAALNASPKRLSPLGGTRELGSHKGYGLAMMVDILSSVLSGSFIGGYNLKTGKREKYINVGHFMLAIDPRAFREDGEFEDELDDLIEMLHATPPLDPSQPVLVAGDPEHESRIERMANGIPMTDTLAREVREVAEACGAPFMLGN
jgi:LDH2 family malate/lactate/ureidoglycolate dehydrogenase